jgi:hypothetical protein
MREAVFVPCTNSTSILLSNTRYRHRAFLESKYEEQKEHVQRKRCVEVSNLHAIVACRCALQQQLRTHQRRAASDCNVARDDCPVHLHVTLDVRVRTRAQKRYIYKLFVLLIDAYEFRCWPKLKLSPNEIDEVMISRWTIQAMRQLQVMRQLRVRSHQKQQMTGVSQRASDRSLACQSWGSCSETKFRSDRYQIRPDDWTNCKCDCVSLSIDTIDRVVQVGANQLRNDRDWQKPRRVLEMINCPSIQAIMSIE